MIFGGVARWHNKAFKSLGEVKPLESAMEHAQVLMTIDLQPVAMLKEKPSEVQLLTEQVALLTKKVAALSTCQQRHKQSESGRRPRYFPCSQYGHVQKKCPYRCQGITCYACGQSGHIARNCQVQGNKWGDAWTWLKASPSRIPTTNQSDITAITVAAGKSGATMIKWKLGGVAIEFMLDYGSSVSLVQCDILKIVNNVTQVDTTKTLKLVAASV